MENWRQQSETPQEGKDTEVTKPKGRKNLKTLNSIKMKEKRENRRVFIKKFSIQEIIGALFENL